VTPPNPTSKPKKGKKKPSPKRQKATQSSLRSSVICRFVTEVEDDDVLVGGGSMLGQGFGRCGGRMLSSKLEQTICGLLSDAGLTHSHSPRYFEVPVTEDAVGAYAPLVVLRGRGRGGKTVVIECADEIEPSILAKIVAFREKFKSEFYVIFIAPEEVLDLIPLAAYDESSVTTDLGTLINRLAD
jgi:hypothetical protein